MIDEFTPCLKGTLIVEGSVDIQGFVLLPLHLTQICKLYTLLGCVQVQITTNC